MLLPEKDNTRMWLASDEEPNEAEELDEMMQNHHSSGRVVGVAVLLSLLMLAFFTVLAIKIFGKP